MAILSRFPLAEAAVLHQVAPYGGGKLTRGILQATFDVFGQPVTILANHWPSQASPDEFREQLAQKLRKIVLDQEKQNSRRKIASAIIAAGDFNTLPTDDPNGLNTWVLNETLSPTFQDPLEVMVDDPMAPGSHWYRGKWNYLDRIIVWNQHLGMRPLWNTFQVVMHPWMVFDLEWKDWQTGETHVHPNVPLRFSPKTGRGYSDHLPLVMEFEVVL